MEPESRREARQKFGRRDRLLRRLDFVAVQDQGRRVSGAHYLLLARPRADEGPARLGITVSKKVGNAVVRNQIKRWVRESYRRMETRAPSRLDLVLIARPSAASGSYQKTADELSGLLRRLPRT